MNNVSLVLRNIWRKYDRVVFVSPMMNDAGLLISESGVQKNPRPGFAAGMGGGNNEKKTMKKRMVIMEGIISGRRTLCVHRSRGRPWGWLRASGRGHAESARTERFQNDIQATSFQGRCCSVVQEKIISLPHKEHMLFKMGKHRAKNTYTETNTIKTL